MGLQLQPRDFSHSGFMCFERCLMLKGLMHLPIANEFEGFSFFIHLEALQAVSDLSYYGIANRAQSGTVNVQLLWLVTLPDSRNVLECR